MRKLSCLFLSLACLLAYASPNKADFQRQYDKLSRAFEHKDAKAYFSFLADGFHQEIKGQPGMSAAQIKADFKNQMDRMSQVHWARKVVKVSPLQDGYDVTVSGHLAGKVQGKDGKAHQLAVDAVSIDRWNRQMKITLSNVQSFSIISDGKKISGG